MGQHETSDSKTLIVTMSSRTFVSSQSIGSICMHRRDGRLIEARTDEGFAVWINPGAISWMRSVD